MKALIPSCILLTGVLVLAACESTPKTPAPTSTTSADGRVKVTFENPADFTDLKSSSMDDFDEGYMEELREYVERTAVQMLAPGENLEITFTDFDMAGEYEPWRMQASDVRMVKSIYIPRAKFHWAVKDASGKTLREGTENIEDMSYRVNIGNITQDELFYEKEMLGNWMRLNLRAKQPS
jgi:hypothetical protein